MKCPYCSTELSGVYFSTVCSKCGKSLHTCLTCKFYLKGAHYDCKEDVDEFIADKGRNNFCSYFSLTDKMLDEKNSSGSSANKTNTSAEELFNKFFT